MKKSLLYNIWKNRTNILKGLLNRIYVKSNIKILAEERLSICESCPFSSENATKRPYGKLPYTHCTACGCSLNVKPYAPQAECPKGKWEQLISRGYLINNGWSIAEPPYTAPNMTSAGMNIPYIKGKTKIHYWKHDLIIMEENEIKFIGTYRDINNFNNLINKYASR